MIDLSNFFSNLGIISGNTNSTNQYEFYYGIVWNDNTITYNQYEFYQKIGMSRYEFYKQYGGEYEFFKLISNPNIFDMTTFYQYGGQYLVPTSDWLLEGGIWNDNGTWIDSSVWID